MASIYNVLSIVRGTAVDGPGFRTSIYLAGCTHACPGCHNPQSWQFNAGTPMTLEEIMDIVREEDFNVTLSGGDPLCTPSTTLLLVEALKADHRNIWLYTGYTWEEIIATATITEPESPITEIDATTALPTLFEIVKKVDVLVDGPYIAALRDPDLLFRGSSNQRLIDIPATLTHSLTTPIPYH